MKKKINIIRSETWMSDTPLKDADRILNSTLQDFVLSSEKIINIQFVEGKNGLNRFWIYTSN